MSETSADVRDLLEREASDPRAAEALALFCYQAKKWIGAFAAALGGLDTLVFAGGIGENAAPVRKRICDGLEFLGNRDRRERQRAGMRRAFRPARASVAVRVIRTDEESVIAALTHPAAGIGTRHRRSEDHATTGCSADARCGSGAENRCLLACGELPVRRPDLSLRQPAAERAAGARAHQAHAAGTLGHHAGTEFHLHASESDHQEIRRGHDLHVGTGTWRSGGGGQHLSRGHLQRGLCQYQSG